MLIGGRERCLPGNASLCPGDDSQEENRCRACIEKNGVGPKDAQEAAKDNEASDMKKTSKDIAVSTSSRQAGEDVDREACHGKDNGKETDAKDKSRSRSGHARTHAIVINLDDKSRFSEEVTV